jgi:ribosomal protein S18 acetylase RimI-like enzyme
MTQSAAKIRITTAKIRKTNIDDAPSIFDIQKINWLQVYPNEKHGVKYQDIAERFKNKEEFLIRIKKGIESYGNDRQGRVAELAGRVVGFSVAGQEDDGKNMIQAIYVLPEYQNKGIGQLLLEEIIKFSKKSQEFWLEVAPYNRQAIRFYEKFGFRLVPGSAGRHRIIDGKFIPTIKMRKVS